MLGSSPHTRGALGCRRLIRRWLRIIPAYAGSTDPSTGMSIKQRDHPRIRGEHERLDDYPSLWLGSSPHTRGARELHRQNGNPRRIIPAYAGSTSISGQLRTPPKDHPRIRGEHPGVFAFLSPGAVDHPRIRGEHGPVDGHVDQATGSSPHTRGARTVGRLPVSLVGIIPAYAGSTGGRYQFERAWKDHPRIRGEHSLFSARSPLSRGSSPHTRGAQAILVDSDFFVGIIPAYAGSTARRTEAPARTPGSSPHTRGALNGASIGYKARRIIPAYAGSTDVRESMPRTDQDHPRIRGEHPWTFKQG